MPNNRFRSLLDDFYQYVDARFELFKLETEERLLKLNAILFELGAALVLLSIMFLFLNLGLAFYLNQVLGNQYIGFVVMAGIQLGSLIFILLANRLFPKLIKRLIKNSFTRLISRLLRD